MGKIFLKHSLGQSQVNPTPRKFETSTSTSLNASNNIYNFVLILGENFPFLNFESKFIMVVLEIRLVKCDHDFQILFQVCVHRSRALLILDLVTTLHLTRRVVPVFVVLSWG